MAARHSEREVALANCAYCESIGAPGPGGCPACGRISDEGVLQTVSFDDLEPTEPRAAPVVRPIETDELHPTAEPLTSLQPIDEAPTVGPVTSQTVAPLPVLQPAGSGTVDVVHEIDPGEEPTRHLGDETGPTMDVPVVQPAAPVVQPVAPVVQPVAPVVQPVAPVVQPAHEPLMLEPLAPEPAEEEIEVAPVAIMPAESTAHAQLQLRCSYEYSSVPAEDPPLMGVMVEFEAQGRPIVNAAVGPVAHVVLALDLSASMNEPDKYPVLCDAIGAMLDDLCAPGAADVVISVIVFSKGAEVLRRAVRARDIDKQELFDAMRSSKLCFGRYTDIAGALSRAARIAYDQSRADRTLPIRIYLMTDGKPQDVAGANEIMEKASKVCADMAALAFGTDADVSVLQQLFSGKRGGTVKSVRADTIGSAFERVAEVAQRVVATRTLAMVELAPGVVGGDAFRYRPGRVRYPEPAFKNGKVFQTDLGTIETGRKYSLLFEVRPPETTERITRMGRFTVRIPGFGGPIEETLDFTLPRTVAGSELGEIETVVRTARDILGALDSRDPQTALRALKLRRDIYEQEKRDPGLLAILDKAIELLGSKGNLDDLSPGDYATLLAHTCTSGSEGSREYRPG